MQLQLKPDNKLTYKLTPLLHVRTGLRLTPQMRLNINLLQMPLNKLKEHVKQQSEENPLLNIEQPQRSPPQVEKEKIEDNFDIDKKGEFQSTSVSDGDDEEKQNHRESLITKPATLADYLLEQLRLFVKSDEESKIGELIIGDIDDNGYLKCSLDEIAESSKTTTAKVEKVLILIQTFDPTGVASRDLRECLFLQLKAKGEENSLAGQIVDKYLGFLEKKRFEYIAKKLSVSVEKVKEAIEKIASLNPKPGRAFNNEKTNYLIPDAVVSKKEEDKYEVIMNDWELPCITLNDKYKQMIRQKDIPQDAKEYLKERLKSARSLINAVHKRKETIQKVIEDIICAQKDFLDNGEANFKPMNLEQIAKRIGKHKSTVSRAIANKYLQTPYGIFELRSFLNHGVKQVNDELLSSKTIKSRMKELIENENKGNPLSDKKITGSLKQEGITISRRTVAKYRHQLRILSSQSRRE